MQEPIGVWRLAMALLALALVAAICAGCVYDSTPCGTRIAFATTVAGGTFECSTAAGDRVKGGVEGSQAEMAAIIQVIGAAFAAGAKAVVP